MKNHTKQVYFKNTYWRKIALDFIWVPIAFVSIFILSSYYNFVDNYYFWARQYESNLDLDELLPALLASLIALLWFTNRRIVESRFLLKQNHALVQRVLEVQEDERKRIARDLHDDLGQYLTAINAQAASLLLEQNHQKHSKQTAKSIISSADHAYQVTQHLIRSLRPVAIDELGLSAALEHLIDTWQTLSTSNKDKTKSQIDYKLTTNGDIDRFNEAINMSVFRIVQEALTNIAKHAQAKVVLINLHANDKDLNIEISDNGIGFDTSKQYRGFGLLGMQERVEALNGSIGISSIAEKNRTDSGTKINIQIKV